MTVILKTIVLAQHMAMFTCSVSVPNSSISLLVALTRKLTKLFCLFFEWRLHYHFSSYKIAVLTNLGVHFNIHNQARIFSLVSLSLTKWHIPHGDITIPEEITLRIFGSCNEITFPEIFLTVCRGNKQAYKVFRPGRWFRKLNFYYFRHRL